jgi:chromosomal replication initiator protein
MTDPAAQTEHDHVSVWETIAEQLMANIPRQSFLTWFRPLEPLSFDGSLLALQVPSQFYSDWIESHYQDSLQQAINTALKRPIEIKLCVSQNGKPNGIPRQSEVTTISRSTAPVRPEMNRRRNIEPFESHLNERYTFANFVEGDCNRFGRAAALAVGDAPGKTPFNPLMIYGASGLGKTHLIQAIGNHILERNTARRVIYVTSEQFTIEFVKAIQSGRSESFSRLYRGVDVLLLDDVQFFMSKEKTQEEFFHTFNYLHHAGKQLVFSSDRSPRDLEGFDARLVSRLQWGLVSEITVPEYETRLAILQHRAEEEKVELPKEVAHFVALHITDNVRSLHGTLIHMLAQASLMGRKISIDLAREVLKTVVAKAEHSVSVERIQDLVAEAFGFPTDLLRAKTRKKEIAEARQVAMYLCTEYTRLTLKAIGLYFGGRDHATVIHARETINERIKVEDGLVSLIEEIRRKLELASL